MRILITGATGLVGSRVIELLGNDHTCIPLTSTHADITNRDSVWTYVKDISFDTCIHMAGYTHVDKAEQEPDLAYALNVDGTRNVLEVTQEKNASFIHISTDFVFDGKSQNPYTEDNTPNPISIYGKTKSQAEQIVENEGMIVRISYPYRKEFERKRDIVRTIKSLLEQGKQLTMITDSIMTPTFIDDIAYGLHDLVTNYDRRIVHLVGADSMSPYDLGMTVATNWGLDKGRIAQTTYEEYFAGKAQRPQFCTVRATPLPHHQMKTCAQGLVACL